MLSNYIKLISSIIITIYAEQVFITILLMLLVHSYIIKGVFYFNKINLWNKVQICTNQGNIRIF